MNLNTEELKVLIANQMKNENLHDSLPEDAIERIKEKILARDRVDSAKSIPSIVSETDTLSLPSDNDEKKFPDEREIAAAPQQMDISGDTAVDGVEIITPGAAPIEKPFEPVVAYTPELPDMLKEASPGEVFVFDYNEVGQSGENLSFKPMRLMDDPDAKKSMNDLWIQEGKTKAIIYVAKFEKMGEIDFNYSDGTSKLTETAALPDYAGGNQFKENPYIPEALPQIDEPTKNELETYIKSSVDLEKVVHEIVIDIMKNSLLTNTEKIEEEIAAPVDRPGYGIDPAQALRPMEENFELSMDSLIESDDFEKVTLPKKLNEAILANDGSLTQILVKNTDGTVKYKDVDNMLVRENESIQEWKFEDVLYYTPTNRLSKTKGYIKS